MNLELKTGMQTVVCIKGWPMPKRLRRTGLSQMLSINAWSRVTSQHYRDLKESLEMMVKTIEFGVNLEASHSVIASLPVTQAEVVSRC